MLAPEPADPAATAIFPGGWPQRLWFAGATIFLPAIGLVIAMSDLFKPDWQRPDVAASVLLLLSRSGFAPFAPLVLAVIVFNGAVFLRPGAWVTSAWARVTLAIGFLLGLQYSILIPAALFFDVGRDELPRAGNAWFLFGLFLVATYGGTFAVPIAFRYLRRRLPPILLIVVCALAFLAFMIFCSLLLPHGPTQTTTQRLDGGWLGVAIFGPLLALFAFPVWTTDAIGRVLWHLGRPRTWPVFPATASLGAYLIAWRLAILRSIEAYGALPESKPSCFVATAAAQAPSWLTGSFLRGDGLRVSPQLQRLKLFELTLEALLPRCHSRLRTRYDQIGPAIAGRIDSSSRAALAYLALLPAELAAMVLLWPISGAAIVRRARFLYRS